MTAAKKTLEFMMARYINVPGCFILDAFERDGFYWLIVLIKSKDFCEDDFSVEIILHFFGCSGQIGLPARLSSSQGNLTIHIDEIAGEPNKGYGSIMMSHLKEYAKKNHIEKITGTLAPVDMRDHPERLLHFYAKHGFEVFDTGHPETKRIELKLNR